MHDPRAELGQGARTAGAGRETHADQIIARVAARQAGNVSIEQLRDAGLGRGAIAHRVAVGRLHRRHRGVFAVGHTAEPPHAGEWAAVLACGPGAMVSHRSAIELLELLKPSERTVVDVSIPRRSTRRHAGIRVHRTPALAPQDTGRWDGVPVTAPARALLDFAERAGPRELERAVSEAIIQSLTTRRALADVIARHPWHRGTPLLRPLVAAPKLTHEGVEALLLTGLRRARLPEPETNVPFHGWNVDFLWRERRLVVETDGALFHGVPPAVERDRRKEADLRSKRCTVLRYSWTQVANEVEFVTAEIAVALATLGAQS